MIKFKHHGDFKKTRRYFQWAIDWKVKPILEYYGQMGLDELIKHTPKDTGKTAKSWKYEVTGKNGHYKITWSNTNQNGNVLIAVLIQYGHGTGWGAYVPGIDYINPSVRPIFEYIADAAWKEVTSL